MSVWWRLVESQAGSQMCDAKSNWFHTWYDFVLELLHLNLEKPCRFRSTSMNIAYTRKYIYIYICVYIYYCIISCDNEVQCYQVRALGGQEINNTIFCLSMVMTYFSKMEDFLTTRRLAAMKWSLSCIPIPKLHQLWQFNTVWSADGQHDMTLPSAKFCFATLLVFSWLEIISICFACHQAHIAQKDSMVFWWKLTKTRLSQSYHSHGNRERAQLNLIFQYFNIKMAYKIKCYRPYSCKIT